MIDDSMKEIINDFVQEALELLDSLSENFIELEKNPDDKELLNTIFRAAHTIKGSAGFLGFQNLVELAHSAENILNRLRQGEIKLTSDMMDYLLKTMDILTAMIRNINDSGEEGNFDNEEIIHKLNQLAADERTEETAAEQRTEEIKPPEGNFGTANNNISPQEAESSENNKNIDNNIANTEANVNVNDNNSKISDNDNSKNNNKKNIEESSIPAGGSNTGSEKHHPKRKVRNLGDILLEDNLMSPDELSQILKEKEEEEKKEQEQEKDEEQEHDGVKSNNADVSADITDKNINIKETDKSDAVNKKDEIDGADRLNIINNSNDANKIINNNKTENLNKTVKIAEAEKQTLKKEPPQTPVSSEIKKPVLASVQPQPQMQQIHPAVTAPVETTIRVDVERLDNVMNLVGELVLSRNRIFNIASKLELKYPEDEFTDTLIEVVSNLNLITTDLQLAVMKTRMQPVKKVFSKFPRMVRDLSKELGKEIELNIAGEETELDKSVIEEIGDPLVHLIRNSIDHGIEMPEDRIKAGKSKAGTINLSAEHEGNYIIIEVSDDGKGMDPDILRKKAVEKGLIDDKTAASISDKDALSLIFAPGFSTKDKVTEISGRGVGMDVVKTNIQKLNGIIDIESEKGKGSDIILKLPLTVAIIQTLIIGVEDEVFAIPLNSVVETLRIPESSIQTIDNHEVINLRKSVLSLLRLSEEFSVGASQNKPLQSAGNSPAADKKALSGKEVYVVVVALAEKRIGIVVDTLYGQEEVVIKSLGDYQFGYKGISGATITGDGKVVLIMDIASMIDVLQKR
ncbi:MAG: chemotaxis protein CheA [Candidatus Acididesulfobacter guangdongensis]|uniref:histidine kinase n=1 Tax=Acididesulfobacter guangdongensis TaxID=2597225 RepID=A0A519BG10_ACIG2|nr:MAG: chemotaxis protein CheA [Candidatus Acididesulfobacter guangdongensis]